MGDCQAQGSKRIQLGLGPRLTLPSLRKLLLPHDLSLRCVTVVSVSVSDQMPSSLPCLSHVFHLSVALCLPLSVYASLCVCGSVCVCVCVCASVPVSNLSACHIYSPIRGRCYSRQQPNCRSHPSHTSVVDYFHFSAEPPKYPKTVGGESSPTVFFLMMRVILFYCLRFI